MTVIHMMLTINETVSEAENDHSASILHNLDGKDRYVAFSIRAEMLFELVTMVLTRTPEINPPTPILPHTIVPIGQPYPCLCA
jgi:hypothetical protein